MSDRLPRQTDKTAAGEGPSAPEKIQEWEDRARVLWLEKRDLAPLSQEIGRDWAEDPACARDVVDHLAAIREPWVGDLLFRLSNLPVPKPCRREIKRILYRLGQQGLDIPLSADLQEGEKKPGILRGSEPQTSEGFLSDFDDLGHRLVALVLPQFPKGRILVLALTHWDRGLEDLSLLEVPKKQVRRVLEETQERSGQQFFPVGAPQAVFLLREARNQTGRLKQEDEQAYALLLPRLEAAGPALSESLIRSLIPDAGEGHGQGGDAEGLTTLPELVRFHTYSEELVACAKRIEEIKASPLVLSPAQQSGRLGEVIDQAAKEFFGEERLARLIRFLEEISFLYWIKGEAGKARQILESLAAFRRELDSRPEGVHPLLTWLIEKEFVSPDDPGEPDEPPEEERTEGGLILPSWVKK